MDDLDVPDYSWLSDPVGRPEAMCITVATGLSPEEAFERYPAAYLAA